MEESLTVPTVEAQSRLGERIYGADKPPRWRSQAERDHDRLLYSSAFQRLGGITQVTASELGRPFHTRLTHTLKVAQVTRRSAERLVRMRESGALAGSAARLVECLDVDSADSTALAHDIGHPPFGHLAESVLNSKAAAAGGFEGNAQSFRVVTRLAMRNAKPGLDLTRRTLNGMLKYPWMRSEDHEDQKRRRKWGAYGSDQPAFDFARASSHGTERSLEACLMDWADDITYAVHDLDDFARAGLIPLDRLAHDERELNRFAERLRAEAQLDPTGPSPDQLLEALEEALAHIDLEGIYEERPTQRVALRSFGSMLITQYVDALSVVAAGSDTATVVIEERSAWQVEALKQLTMLYVVRRPSLAVIQHGQAVVIGQLWDWYMEATEPKGDKRLLPPPYRDRLEDDQSEPARARLVTDLVAGMTEASALALYRRMAGVGTGSVLDAAAHAG